MPIAEDDRLLPNIFGRTRMMRPVCDLLLGLLVVAAALSACGRKEGPPSTPTPITVQLRWTHQAQFAGFYAADQKGYYAAEGLTVAFLEGGPRADLLTPVLDGTAQFGDAGADALLVGRTEGKPLRAIATIYRRSPAIFFARTDLGIRQPQDFVGKTIHVPPDLIPSLRAMMARVGIRPGQYTEGNFGTDLTPFFSGKVPVWGGMIIGKALLSARLAGYELSLIYPDDYGVHLYADTIFTTEDLIARDPQVVTRFLRATLKGWTYAVENSEAAAAMVVKYKPDSNRAYDTASLTASLPLINTGEDRIGWMRPEVWAGMARILQEQGVLTKPVDVSQAYTLEFLREIYGQGR